MVHSSLWERFRGAGEHTIPAHCSFVVILWSKLYCVCFCERSKEGSVWIVKIMSVLYIYFVLYMHCNLLWMNDRGKWEVMWHYVGGPPSRWSLCMFWRETRQRVWTRDLDATGSRKRTRVGSWTKELRGGCWRRKTQSGRGVDTGHLRDLSHERERVQHQWGKTSHDELAFLVALWKFRQWCTSALVYICKGMQLNLLALELTQAYCSFVLCSFLPLPWLYFL